MKTTSSDWIGRQTSKIHQHHTLWFYLLTVNTNWTRLKQTRSDQSTIFITGSRIYSLLNVNPSGFMNISFQSVFWLWYIHLCFPWSITLFLKLLLHQYGDPRQHSLLGAVPSDSDSGDDRGVAEEEEEELSPGGLLRHHYVAQCWSPHSLLQVKTRNLNHATVI